MSIIQRMLAILLAAGAVALVQGLIIGKVDLGDTDDGFMISLSEAGETGDVIWVDARQMEAYDAGHYPGAIHITEDDWDTGLGKILTVWDFEQSIVVYCDGGDCASSREYAARLRQDIGSEGVFWLKDGWQALRGVVDQ